MTNFTFEFAYPWSAWLLFLLIPAVAFTLIPYFLLNKKYRRTRNRITSIVLHLIIMVLSICVLSGMTFAYDVPNESNEVILLVDVSFSGEEAEDQRNEFIQDAIAASEEGFKLGIVTFGYDQHYAVPLTSNMRNIYNDYLNAPRPDDTATDIASALTYAKTLFSHPGSGKIVLLTDGMETDGKATSVVRSVVAEGIRVDTVYFSTEKHDEVQIIDVVEPDYHITVGDPFSLGLTLQSSYSGSANVTLYEEGVAQSVTQVALEEGIQNVQIQHTFDLPGIHEISFEIESNGDTLTQNNRFHSYINLEVFDDILILGRDADEAARIRTLLGEQFNVNVVDINDLDSVPQDVDGLRMYDQVILMNIANSDMPAGFDLMLHTYVHEYGGGLLTVGGDKVDVTGESVANTYNREDMQGTLYQDMLPVQAIDYTPPVGVVIIIDRSGSMQSSDGSTGQTKLEQAKSGAMSCLDALTERDYCGIMTLEDDYTADTQILPMPEKAKLVAAIDAIGDDGGGTVFRGALEAAGRALTSLTTVERKHIMLVTDGAPFDPLEDTETEAGYGGIILNNFEKEGITLSIVGIGCTADDAENMRRAAEEFGHGRYHDVREARNLPREMREDLNVPEIKDIIYEPFTPRIVGHSAVTAGVTQDEMPQLEGYYGTKLKEGATARLMGEYVPIYAEWRYGAGTVGSFMCDLNGHWSDAFLNAPAGRRIIENIIGTLFPLEDIKPKEIEAELREDNYTTQMSIYTDMEEGQTIEVTITSPPDELGNPSVQTILPSAAEGFSRASFVIRQPGVHQVLIQKKDAEGAVLAECVVYKVFSYSEEYNVFLDEEESRVFLQTLADSGRGELIDDAVAIYEDFDKTIHKTFDPRLPFIIIAIVLFLLDIAVRKFKFKWPHELVRDFRQKRAKTAR